jgi:hypothetical protein
MMRAPAIIAEKSRSAIRVAHPALESKCTQIFTAPSSDGARAHSQLELFASTAPALPSVVAPRPCRCGCAMAVLGGSRGPHARELRCESCDAHVGWLSGESYRFVSDFVSTFGRPAEAIDLRHPPFVSGISSYAAGC